MSDVLDPRQLRRIQNVHRGFLYQHLYAVSCLFRLSSTGPLALAVERDEDIELEYPNSKRYVQIKTRKEALTYSDVTDALERFAAIRVEHAAGRRIGTCELIIVSNVKAAPSLIERMNSKDWPAGIRVLTPIAEMIPDGLTRPWVDLNEAVERCIAMAQEISHKLIDEETLVWKLASMIQAAAAGGAKRVRVSFRVADLPTIFEQLQTPLQELPVAPRPYRIQEDEPSLEDDTASPLLLVGFSGAGKTSWVAEQALHTAAQVVYFDVRELPAAALGSAIARELAARLFARKGSSLASVLRPGASGMDAMRALNQAVGHVPERPILILDNIHTAEPEALAPVVAAAPHLRWCLIGQPFPGLGVLEASLQRRSVQMAGWSTEEIAAEFRSHTVAITFTECERIRRLTAGQPMFVRNAAQLVAERADREVKSWCDDVERSAHETSTAQEYLLGRIWMALSSEAKQAAGVLSVLDILLPFKEVKALIVASGASETQVGTSLRELGRWAILTKALGGEMGLHDAFRVIGKQEWERCTPATKNATKNELIRILSSPSSLGRGPKALSLLLRSLVETGRAGDFVNIASNESQMLYEVGLTSVCEELAQGIANDKSVSPKDRFWMTDVLAYLAFQRRREDQVEQRVREMEALMSKFAPGREEYGAYYTKKLATASTIRECKDIYRASCVSAAHDTVYGRIMQYQYAVGLHRLEALEEALEVLQDLRGKYYERFAMGPEGLFLAKNAELVGRLSAVEGWEDEARRFADVLSFSTKILDRLGCRPAFDMIWAMKLYGVTGSYSSMVETGQDVVDYFIDNGDAKGAMQVLEEHLLPAVRELKLLEYSFRVRSQYAVVLAYLGRMVEAKDELRRLEAYRGPTPQDEQTFRKQVELVERIALGRVSLRRYGPAALPYKEIPVKRGKQKPNEKCSCGSGMKFKKCHGASS